MVYPSVFKSFKQHFLSPLAYKMDNDKGRKLKRAPLLIILKTENNIITIAMAKKLQTCTKNENTGSNRKLS